MKAVVWHDVGDIRLDDVKEPRVERATDAVVRLTGSAICGTDLHMIRGTMGGMTRGTILGHEGIGIVEKVGNSVTNLAPGDRVVIPSSIACGYCAYCRSGYYAKCDNANPNGKDKGTAFYGGPKQTGPFNGMQAEKVRVPFANVGLIKLPDDVSDTKAITLSDIFPTAYFGADMANIKPGHSVAIFGCGPVGQLTIASAKIMGAGRIFAVDSVPARLEMAKWQGAEVINFDAVDPMQKILELTGGIGVDSAIDAVGIDAVMPTHGPAARRNNGERKKFDQELSEMNTEIKEDGSDWNPGNAPSLVLEWAVDSLAKAGHLSIIGVYPPNFQHFPIGKMMGKNLTVRAGDCNHRKYIPKLLDIIKTREFDPSGIITDHVQFDNVIDAYNAFDKREHGCVKVMLQYEG